MAVRAGLCKHSGNPALRDTKVRFGELLQGVLVNGLKNPWFTLLFRHFQCRAGNSDLAYNIHVGRQVVSNPM